MCDQGDCAMFTKCSLIVTLELILGCALLWTAPAAAAPLCGTSGDGNGDCRISLDDHIEFVACFSGPEVSAAPECACYDMDGDGHVDLADAARFQRDFTGDSLIAGCVLPIRLEEPGTLRAKTSGSPDKPYWGIPDSSASDSVYLFSGEFHHTETDLVIRGRGYDFEWTRRYRSRIGPDTAMGNGWDHSYNVYLESSGPNLVLHNGDGRSDEYCLLPNGTWTHPEFFSEIRQTPIGDYERVDFDRSISVMRGFNGLPDDGKIVSMSDRYGNTTTFEYDLAGRLTTIRDTLDSPVNPRAITIAYNVDGFIQSVTDFTGRQVTYTYYQDPDVGGDAGDLRTVTSPPVVGTPNGNDFPLGKTTTYTYTDGSPIVRLNHNLLTITDPQGQVYLSNTYHPTANPVDIAFDRCISQQRGTPNEILFFHYIALAPAPANNFATGMCIVNDRVGNVEECFYDYRNRLAMVRRYTGRANPLAPTTDVLNRPFNPLRPTDPPYFESRFQYNSESLLTRVVAPELDSVSMVYEGDEDFFAPQRRKVQPKRRTHQPGPRGGAQQQIVEQFEFDSVQNFDSGRITLYVDGRGNSTTFEYDASGNLTRAAQAIQSVVDEFAYNAFGQITLRRAPDNGSGHQMETEFHYYPPAAGPQSGYLESVVEDAPGFALTTTYEYDSRGNMTRMVDPRGNDSLYDYNQLDQIVRTRSPEVVPAVGPRYETLTYFDANDNVVRIDVENRDANGVLGANTHFTTEYQYDILNNVTRVSEEVDLANTVVTEYEYDANRNPALIRLGEATNGNQPANTITHTYDERDLVFRSTRAATDPRESTTQYDYDGDGNLTRMLQGLQGPVPREFSYAYDGYNRLTIRGDHFGNEAHFEYDANGNVEGDAVFGELVDIPGNGGNVRMSESLYAYDAINRLTIHGAKFFDSAQAPLTDGESTTTFVYSDSSHLLQMTDDNGHATGCTYDTANRREVCTDAKGNTLRYIYDASSNVTSEVSNDKSDLGLPDQQFTDTYAYDGLNRLTIRGDNFGNTRSSLYNSRGLVEEDIDALGNLTTYAYDGMNRLTITGHVLTATGAGGGPVVGIVQSTQTWDDSSRLVEQIDSHGNVTVTGHDPLNRPTIVNYADGTSQSFLYDVHDNKTVHVDANGTQIDYFYDAVNRLSSKAVIPAPGVSNDTTFELYTYDGLDRIVSAEDDDSVVTFTYDSLSNVTSESLNGMTTSSSHDGLGNPLQCVYPNGRTIDRAFDELDRVQDITDGPAAVAGFQYVGGRVQRRSLGNGSQTLYEYNGITGVPNRPGDFGVRLPSLILHNHPGLGTTIDVRTFTWDAQYNRTQRAATLTALRHEYTYDSVYRLTRTVVNDVNPPAPTLIRDTQYTLDLVGNRNLVVDDNCPGAYTLNPANPPADFQMNQYTSTGCDSRFYDENGNWTVQAIGGPAARMTYDYKDRLIRHDDFATGTATVMSYDPFDRRLRQVVSVGAPVSEIDYFYDGPDVIMEQDGWGAFSTYVFGDGVDEIISMRRGSDELYYHCDDLGNVLALTDTNGAVVERYDYQDYGQPEFYDAGGLPIPGSAVENPYLFGGRRFDATTGLYSYGERYLDPVAGRFSSRDPSGAWSNSLDHGNAYSFAGGNPWSNTRGHDEDVSSKTDKSEAARAKKKSMMGGGHHGHVTILKLAGGGDFGWVYWADKSIRGQSSAPGSGIDYNSSRSNKTSGIVAPPPGGGGGGRGPDKPHRHRGHVTILKAAGGGGDGYFDCFPTVWTLGTYLGGIDYNSSRSNKTSSIVAPSPGGGGAGGRGPDKPHRHRGHVTILKMSGGIIPPGQLGDCRPDVYAMGGSGGGIGFGWILWTDPRAYSGAPGGGIDYNSSRSNKTSGIVAPPPGGGEGEASSARGRWCTCGGQPLHFHHSGHVTVLKFAGVSGGGAGGSMSCESANKASNCPRCKKPRSQCRCNQKHRGHVTILK